MRKNLIGRISKISENGCFCLWPFMLMFNLISRFMRRAHPWCDHFMCMYAQIIVSSLAKHDLMWRFELVPFLLRNPHDHRLFCREFWQIVAPSCVVIISACSKLDQSWCWDQLLFFQFHWWFCFICFHKSISCSSRAAGASFFKFECAACNWNSARKVKLCFVSPNHLVHPSLQTWRL